MEQVKLKVKMTTKQVLNKPKKEQKPKK